MCNQACACWWVANACEADKTQPAKLVCRSIAVLRLELQQNRVASTEKLRREWERRLDDNKRSVDVLMNNRHLWSHVSDCKYINVSALPPAPTRTVLALVHVDGPSPEDELVDPTELALLEAKQCCEALARMAEAHGSAQNELHVYVEEITKAVSAIKIVSWEAIRQDRFTLTPPDRRMA